MKRPRRTHGHTFHGKPPSPTYRSWQSMRTRCLNPKSDRYQDYGAKGITVCERWNSFINFLADMGERPAGTTLDRIDGTKGYFPGNCRWATPTEQCNNTRSVVILEAEGKRQSVSMWAREKGISVGTLHNRLRKGWSVERALNGDQNVKPRISYAAFQASRLPDFDAMEHEVTQLLLDGEPMVYAGHHYDSLVWLRKHANVYAFKQKDLAGKLKLSGQS